MQATTSMKLLRWIVAGSLVMIMSCSTSRFGKKTAHEKYAEALRSAGLNTSGMGQQWFAAADKSLNQPLRINLPYKETGYFAADKPGSAGYIFTAKRGERLVVKLNTTPASGAALFTELWQPANAGEKPDLLGTIDTVTRQLEYEVEKDGDFLLRLQPELLKGIEYTVTISPTPSLAFPVHSSGNPRIISLWGAERDAGSRSHEGIDIAAPKRTPVVAAADGRITNVGENNLGGKVIFMRPSGKAYNLYYAHLDSQMARPGQQVKQGDVVGLLGNTGNARTTIPHLHFGIYTAGGAIDPIAFIDKNRPLPPAITASLRELNRYVRTRSASTIYNEPSAKAPAMLKPGAGEVMYVLSAVANWYKIILPDGRQGFISSDAVTGEVLRATKLKQQEKLLDAPLPGAASQTMVSSGSNVNVLGRYSNYVFVEYDNRQGWILNNQYF
jgi:peptidoglycan LD-endopeptidase LytH